MRSDEDIREVIQHQILIDIFKVLACGSLSVRQPVQSHCRL